MLNMVPGGVGLRLLTVWAGLQGGLALCLLSGISLPAIALEPDTRETSSQGALTTADPAADAPDLAFAEQAVALPAAAAIADIPSSTTELATATVGVDEQGSLAAGEGVAISAEPEPNVAPSLPLESGVEPESGAEVAEAPTLPLLRVGDLENPEIRPSTAATDLAQSTSVSDLTDVAPADWAYQALANLVETYGCIAGYPDGTFRGGRNLTRYEFAAGLNACLDVIASLGLEAIDPADLETIQRLQEEFTTDLETVRSQVDALEASTAELEANQFATQTKLRGVVFAHLSNGFRGGPIKAEGNSVFSAGRDAAGNPIIRTIDQDSGTTLGVLTWINMDTSFTGEDNLSIQFVAGSAVGPANLYASAGLFNTFGVPFTFQTGGVSTYDLAIREFSYSFPVGDRLTFDVGPRVNWYRHFDNNRYTFFLTGANSFNSSGGTQVNAVDRGSGVVGIWDITDWLDLRVGFLAESTEFLPGMRAADDPTRGLFGGTNTLTAQVGLKPFNNFNLRLLYTRSNLEANSAGLIGGTLSEPLYGFADDGAGGRLANSTADTFLVNFDWTPVDWLGLFGRYSYGSTHLVSEATRQTIGDVNAQSIQVGVAFPDLFKEGALATVSYLIPFDVLDGGNFLVSGGGNGGTQQELEFSYRYPISRHFALVPSFYWIMNANNFSDNPDIYILNMQAQIFF